MYIVSQCLGHFAEENAQDAWNSFWTDSLIGVVKNFNPEKSAFLTYLSTSLKHHCDRFASHLRHIHTKESQLSGDDPERQELQFEDPSLDSNPLKRLEQKELLRLVQEGLDGLKPCYAKVVIDHYIKEQSIAEIADRLQIPCGTVKAWLYRGRQGIKQHMNEVLQ